MPIQISARLDEYPLHVACRHLSYGFVRLLLNRGADPNLADCYDQTPLFIAVATFDLPLTKLLVEHGADVNHQDQEDRTALRCVIESLGVRDCPSSGTDCIDVVRYLLDKGIDVNRTDENNQSALYLASYFGYRYKIYPPKNMTIQLFDLLLERGAEVNVVADSLNGSTIMSRAIKYHGYYEIFELVRHGGDLKWTDEIGSSLLEIASEHSELQTYSILLAAGANPNTVSCQS